MTDLKTTQFPYASYPLSGYEIIGAVQGGSNVKTSIYGIINFFSQRSFVAIGQESATYGHGIAIGSYAIADVRPNAIAIGNHAYAGGASSIAIGDGAYTNFCNRKSVAIGYHANVHTAFGVAIGAYAYLTQFFTTSIGYRANAFEYEGGGRSTTVGAYAYAKGTYSTQVGFSASAGSYSVAIGSGANAVNNRAIAIGYGAHTQNSDQIAIGFQATGHTDSVVVGNGSYCGPFGVAVGNYIQPDATVPYTTSIGYRTGASGPYSTAIGAYAKTNGHSSVAIGDNAYSNSPSTIAMGKHTNALRPYVIAIGSVVSNYGAYSIGIGNSLSIGNPFSIVIGNNVTSLVGNSVALGGNPTLLPLSPHEVYQRFVGTSTSAVAATVRFGNSTITAPESLGSSGNFVAVASPLQAPNTSLSVSYATHLLTIHLTTDSGGDFIDADNTLGAIAALFPFTSSDGVFTMVVDDGHSTDVWNTTIFTGFSGGSGTPTSPVLTSDGLTPGAGNLPIIPNVSIATVSGRVTGVQVDYLTAGSGDTACFLLAPLLVARYNDGSYAFIGTPTFVLENSTPGASGWELPTLTINENTLNITTSNSSVDVNWMAHLKFETSL